MQLQTYENSYRVRSHWHFIESLTPKKIVQLKPKNTPIAEDRPKRTITSPQTKNRSPDSQSRPKLPNIREKGVISRIKFEKEKQVANKQTVIKKGQTKRAQEAQAEEQVWSANRQQRKNYKFSVIFPREQKRPSPQYNRQISPKGSTPKPRAQEVAARPNRKGSYPVRSSLEQFPPSPVGKSNAKQRSKSTGEGPLSPQMQKYLYLSADDQKRIAGIYQKIKRLRVMDVL